MSKFGSFKNFLYICNEIKKSETESLAYISAEPI